MNIKRILKELNAKMDFLSALREEIVDALICTTMLGENRNIAGLRIKFILLSATVDALAEEANEKRQELETGDSAETSTYEEAMKRYAEERELNNNIMELMIDGKGGY